MKIEECKYFVVSSGVQPSRIYFNLQDAKQSEQRFIDAFNELGELVGSLDVGSLELDNNEYI